MNNVNIKEKEENSLHAGKKKEDTHLLIPQSRSVKLTAIYFNLIFLWAKYLCNTPLPLLTWRT